MREIFVRHIQRPDAERPRVFEGLSPGHPLVGTLCPACGYTFLAGERTVLVPLGPGSDIEQGVKAAGGRYYNAVAVAVHSSCALGVG